MLNFLKHKFELPSDRLDIIMRSPESTAHEGTMGLKVYNTLNTLYMSILWEAFCENDSENDSTVCSVLSVVVLVVNPLSQSEITTLLHINFNKLVPLLDSIQSLLVLHDDIDHPIGSFHKPFPDFITERTRCADPQFYISPDYHTDLILCCLKLMVKSLKKNMCSIPDYALNSETLDLPKKVNDGGIRGALEYACRSWYKHLIVTNHWTKDMVSALHCFLEEKFLFWLEVLSVLGVVGDAVHVLNATIKWSTKVCLD